jgi:hypothetical protein
LILIKAGFLHFGLSVDHDLIIFAHGAMASHSNHVRFAIENLYSGGA